ncbi:hypothetical protein Hdeb2414_s0020g00568921 [Helianthus debilis subsp. tardiflorus]
MLASIFSDRPSGAALTGIKYILPDVMMVGILTHVGFRPKMILGESDDGLAKTLGIERLTLAIDAIVVNESLF